MSLLDDFVRAGARRRCPICRKPDWCLIHKEEPGDPSRVICARIESDTRYGDAGWLHVLRETRGRRGRSGRCGRSISTSISRITEQSLDAYDQDLDLDALSRLAHELSVSVSSLLALQVGWNGWAWTFPMRDDRGVLVGVRLRRGDGQKRAVRGSRNGLFIPRTLRGTDPLLVCEGPTDVAAMLDLDFDAVGRPSCSGGAKHVVRLVQVRRPGQVVLVADRDEPGQRGASDLASRLLPYSPDVRVVTPPDGCGDARAWRASGATRRGVRARICGTSPRSLSLRSGGRR